MSGKTNTASFKVYMECSMIYTTYSQVFPNLINRHRLYGKPTFAHGVLVCTFCII